MLCINFYYRECPVLESEIETYHNLAKIGPFHILSGVSEDRVEGQACIGESVHFEVSGDIEVKSDATDEAINRLSACNVDL